MDNNEETKIRERIENYAEKSPFKLNPDEKIVARVVKGLASRKKKYGAELCPCRIVTGDKEKDDKIICPCEYHEEEIKQDGKCHCDLFVADNPI